ncbi:MAG TPA: DUF2279 domain-containing protein [Ohtaekwangia sp.]|nr:DUF2279 domain-containing protein [Ohtaekwangia sp.]
MASKKTMLFCLAMMPLLALAQPPDSAQVNKKKLRRFVIGSAAGYGATLVALNELWYSDAGTQSFRFFDDNAEWKQVDKLGHFYSSFYFSYGASRALQSCHVAKRKADLIGALTGVGVLLPIEIMDGFSDAYGASSGDLIANAAGAAFYLGQSRLWNEIRIFPKFSFQRTGYARLRPEVLGDSWASEALKDYNGQTYWLSVDVDKFMRFPKWLNIAAGYGAHGMIYARDHQNRDHGYGDPYRQFYLALDLDLTALKTRSKALNTLIFFVNMIKLPAPAVSFSRHGSRFHPLAF